MQTYLECVGCLVKQAAEIATNNLPEDRREQFMRDMLERIAGFDYTDSPPIMAMEMYGEVRRRAGIADPYLEIKKTYNSRALKLYPGLREKIVVAPDPLDAALRIAVAGNIIDFGMGTTDNIQVEATIERALREDFVVDDTRRLKEELQAAQNILYLGDNAGEIVFDRLFVETIGPENVTFAVRDVPIINDSTLSDAADAGMNRVCRVISSGSPAPGTPLELCSAEFREIFDQADVVISKGQGNFETLSNPPRPVYFLLMAKCAVIAREIGVDVGSFIAKYQSP